MSSVPRAILVLGVVVVTAALTSCGSSAKIEAKGDPGQELINLQEAYDKGLLTEDDYQKQRKAILDRK